MLVLCVLISMISSKHARADVAPTLTHLSWSAPAASGCFPTRELERSVEALLGRKVIAEREVASHELGGVVEQHQGGWFAVLQLEGKRGNVRRLSSAKECASLNRPLAIVIATSLDTMAENVTTLVHRPALVLGLALDAESGVLPRLALGGRLAASMSLGSGSPVLRVHIGARLPERSEKNGLGARFLAFQPGVATCPELLRRGSLQLALCAGVEAGALMAQALGLSSPRTPSRFLLSVSLEAALAVRVLCELSARIELAPVLGILRPSFYFDDADKNSQVVHRVGLWGGQCTNQFDR